MNQDQQLLREDHYLLEKGFVYFSTRPMKVHTVLGSAVSVCLWDRKLRQGGMNHFTHPRAQSRTSATPRYGNAAMLALLRTMKEAGSATRDIVAQIFGGGISPEETEEDCLGLQNVQVARQILKKKGIKIVSEDVGGSLGRKVAFDLRSGSVAVLKVEQIRRSDWQY